MREYRYLRGGRDCYEAVEFDIKKRGQYITTCVVNVYMLYCGLMSQPCGNGDDYTLTPEERLEILELVQAEREKIRASEEVKTLDGWQRSGLGSWEDITGTLTRHSRPRVKRTAQDALCGSTTAAALEGRQIIGWRRKRGLRGFSTS